MCVPWLSGVAHGSARKAMPFVDFLTSQFSLSSSLAASVAFAVALCPDRSGALGDPAALTQQNRHCRRCTVSASTCDRLAATAPVHFSSASTAARASLRKASAGPTLFAAAAADRRRLSAVFGGVYMLGEDIVAVQPGADSRHRVTLGRAEPQTVTADTVVVAPEYGALLSSVPPASASPDADAVARGVWIVSSLPPALRSATAPAQSDDADAVASSPKPLDAALFVLPPEEGRASSAFALATGEAAFACPADQCARLSTRVV